MRPMALTWSATLLTSAALLRSPTTVPAERDARSVNVAARSADRACSTTWWRSPISDCAAAAQPVRAAGDEDERHQLLLSMSIQNGRRAGVVAGGLQHPVLAVAALKSEQRTEQPVSKILLRS